MKVRRRVFINKISDLITNLLESNEDLSFIKTISKGDLSLLPAPKQYPEYMPAIFINPTDVMNQVNLGKDVTSTEYDFDITYVKYHHEEYSWDIQEEAIREAELIIDTLMEDMDLNRTILPEGRILSTFTPHVSVDSSQNQIFKNLKLPVIVIDINYVVYFRNIKK